MKPQKKKLLVYKVNTKLQVTKAPAVLKQLVGLTFTVAKVTKKEYRLTGAGLLVISKDEIQNKVFKFKTVE